MRTLAFLTMTGLIIFISSGCGGRNRDQTELTNHIISLEREALDRWRQGDPDGFLEIIAGDYTYFDPYVNERVDGYQAIAAIYDDLRGQVDFPRFELIDPRVQVGRDIAVLTFNFKSFGPDSTGNEIQHSHWHTTEVFRRSRREWKLIHTHWSFTAPQLRELAAAGALTGATVDFPVSVRSAPSRGDEGEVLAAEEAALARWMQGDPDGYLGLIAEEYTYFDPSLVKRIDGRAAAADHFEPVRRQGGSSVVRPEIIEPYVQTDGVTAVLTYNLKTWSVDEDGAEQQGSHWHATEIYQRSGQEWTLVSTHWSYTPAWLQVLSPQLQAAQRPD